MSKVARCRQAGHRVRTVVGSGWSRWRVARTISISLTSCPLSFLGCLEGNSPDPVREHNHRCRGSGLMAPTRPESGLPMGWRPPPGGCGGDLAGSAASDETVCGGQDGRTQGTLFRTRDLLLRQRTQTINTLRGHLAEYGVVAPQGRAQIRQLVGVLERRGLGPAGGAGRPAARAD